jgi:hypothetical protein
MRELRIAAASVAFALSACSTTWVRPGGTQDDYERESAQCEAMAAGNPNGVAAIQVYYACMRGKGWKKAEKQ